MSTLEIDVADLAITRVEATESDLLVTLADGRVISTPLWWYPKLQAASRAELANYELMPMGVHWPDLDEDLSVAGMLVGRKAPGAFPPASE